MTLVAVGLIGIMIETVHGGPLSWAGRAAQFLGGAYMVVAAMASVRESGLRGVSLSGALRESESLLRAFFDDPGMLRGIVELAGGALRYVSASKETAAAYGLNPDAVDGKSLQELGVPEETVRIYRDRCEEARRTGLPVSFEVFRRLANGDRWLLVTASYLTNGPTGCPRFAFVMLDITGRKAAEEALRASEEKYRSLVKYAPAAIYEMDLGGTEFLSVNEVMCEILGYSREELLATRPTDLLDSEGRSLFADRIRRKLTGERVTDVAEYRVRRKDGEWIEVAVNVGGIAYSNSAPSRVVAIGYDVTERRRMERALRESEERYRVLVESSNSVILRADKDLNITYMNDFGLRFFGYSAHELIGRNAIGTIIPATDDEGRDLEAMAHDITRTPERYATNVHKNMRKDGTLVWMSWTNNVSDDRDGNVAGILAIGNDISRRIETEESLRRLHERLVLAQQSAGAGFWDWDLQTGHLEWSPELFHFFGLDPTVAKASFDAWRGALHPEDLAAAEEKISGAVRDRVRLQSEYRVVWPTGEVRWISALGHTNYDEKGSPLSMSGLCLDVTMRKQADAALRESEERHRLLADTMLQGVVHQDADGRIIAMNPAAERILGSTREELLGRDWARDGRRAIREDCSPFPGADHPASVALRTGEPQHDVVMGVFDPRLDAYRWISIDAVPVFRPGEGRPCQVYSVFADITERRRMERELHEMNDTLERRVAERTAEVQRLADQLRALAVELSQAEQRERKRLAGILHDHIQQLLVAARMQVGGMKPDSNPERLGATAQSVDGILREALDASRSLTVELCPPVLQETGLIGALKWLASRSQERNQFTVCLRVDNRAEPSAEDVRFLLFECARELVLNAVKHSGASKAEIGLLRTEDDLIKLVVRDEGRGFDPDILKRRRADEACFGLFSIQQRLAHIGGEMEIATAPGKGTRIALTIPAGNEPAGAKRKDAALSREEGSGRVVARQKAARCRVMIVDDHKIMREGLVGLMQFDPEIEVVGQAADGVEAITLAEMLLPDVIVMDVNLSEMSGVEATRRILARHPNIKIIGLSMHVEKDMAAAMRSAGAVAYLTKGGPSEDLIATIKSADGRVSWSGRCTHAGPTHGTRALDADTARRLTSPSAVHAMHAPTEAAMPQNSEKTTSVVERFLRYVTYDTQSAEGSESYPSTAKQIVLLDQLVQELRAIGLVDAQRDEHGYVMATIPATSKKKNVPVVGFIAHVDTSPEVSGAGVKPIIHRNWQGQDIVLPDDPRVVLRSGDIPEMQEQIGNDIITASGTTLLGADNKAGVAEIVAAAEYLVRHPEIPHGNVRIGFTPDEEVGTGTKYFDVAKFGAAFAYTMDGAGRGTLEAETFSADSVTVTFHGVNTHPGFAKGKMVNAIKVAADFIERLPKDVLSPETTEGREGFVHPHVLRGGVEETSIRFLIRDFVTAALEVKEERLEKLARETAAAWPGSAVEIKIEESYRNMMEVLDRHPEVVEVAREAIERAGLTVRSTAVRGGTDGSRLSFMGLPTPNLFAGENNFHSLFEWVSAQDMEKAVEVITHVCRIVEERA